VVSQEEQMPVRTPSNRYGKNIVGKFPSLKLGRMVYFESRVERDQIYLMEYDPEVVFYEEQPLMIEYAMAGKCYKYFPDFKVVTSSGQHLLLECKAERFVGTDKNQRKIAAGQSWCAHRNWEFRLITEQMTRTGCRLENVMLLWQFARHSVPLDVKTRVYTVMNGYPALTMDTLSRQVNPDNPRAAIVPILNMIFHHELSTPIDDARISDLSPVNLPKRNRG
jgi:hypothetical protein